MFTIGQRIKKLREAKGLSLAALAEITGLKKSGLSSYENDKYEPSAKATIALSEALEVTTDYILTGKESTEVQISKPQPNASIVLSSTELDLIMKYRQLDYRDREDAKENIDMKHERMVKRGISSNSTSGGTGEEAATSETA